MRTYQSPGDILDYVNGTGAAIVSGQLVPFDNLIGVATGDIAIGAAGQLMVDSDDDPSYGVAVDYSVKTGILSAGH